ncbi:MAG: adenylate kinase [Dehalococcoidia bacterium]|nr:adenylate kinase [Dehalococcoidia bacterium]
MFLILLGPPGAGKGTQAEAIVARTGVVHIATGDLFRENIRNQTELGKQAQAYVGRGELVPDDLTVRMLLDRIGRPDTAQGVLLDGFPRTTEQARALDEALSARGQAVDQVLYINVGEEEVVRRLGGRWTCRQCGAVYHESFNPPRERGRCDKCGGDLYQRDDDKPETVRNRLAVYNQQTAPLIDFYRGQGKLTEVDGGREAEEVARDLLRAIGAASRGAV